jgi:hypothetical protein
LLNEALNRRWEPVVAPLLVEELGEVLARAKFRRWFTKAEAERLVGDLRRIADVDARSTWPPWSACSTTSSFKMGLRQPSKRWCA